MKTIIAAASFANWEICDFVVRLLNLGSKTINTICGSGGNKVARDSKHKNRKNAHSINTNPLKYMNTTMLQNSQRLGKAWLRCSTSPLLACAVAVLVGTAGSAHAVNLVANGDFSANAASFMTSPGWISGIGPEWSGNPGTIANWECDTYPAAALAINGPSVGFSPKFPQSPVTQPGFNYAWVQWVSQSIYQILPLDPITTYQMDLDAAAAAWQAGGKFIVQLRDATTVLWSSGDQVVSPNGFMHYTFTVTTPTTFTYGAPNIRLAVSGTLGSDGIDFANVSVQVGTPIVVPPGPTNVVANGDFKSNAAEFAGNNGILGAPNAATITSWTAGAGNIGINGPATSAGSAYAPLNGDGGYTFAFSSWGSASSGLSQTLSADYTPGAKYELSFDAAQFRWAPSLAFRVSIFDDSQTHVTTQVGGVDLDSTPLVSFTHFSYVFTAPASFNGPCVIQLLNPDSVTSGAGVCFANVALRLYTPPPLPTLVMRKSGPNLQLNWSRGILLEANNLTGPWTTNSTTSPILVMPTEAKKFFRAMSP